MVCVGLPALALALCTVLGLGTGAAYAAANDHGHAAAVTPARHPLPSAYLRMHDPVGFDVVAAEQPTETSRTADQTTPLLALREGSRTHATEHNRGPPAGEHS